MLDRAPDFNARMREAKRDIAKGHIFRWDDIARWERIAEGFEMNPCPPHDWYRVDPEFGYCRGCGDPFSHA